MKRATPAFWGHVRQLAASLDQRSYYELLEIDAGASDDAVGTAYRRLVRLLHPDRHTGERDPANTAALVRVYARVGEAFRVLGDPPLRQRYDQGLAQGQLRLVEDEGPRGPAPVARDPSHPQARSLYERAMALAAQGDRKAARAQLQLARQFEPASAAIAAKLAELAPLDTAAAAPSQPEAAPSQPAAAPSQPVSAPTPATTTAQPRAATAAQPRAATAAQPRAATAAPVRTATAAPARASGVAAPAAPARAATAAPARASGVAAPATRRHRRLPVDKPIVLRCRDWEQVVTLYAKNVSRSGMFVRSQAPLAVGTAVALTLIAPSGDKLRLAAEVVRVVPAQGGAPAGMGLRFSELDADARRGFEALLAAAEAAKADSAASSRRRAAPTELPADAPAAARPLWSEPIAGAEPALECARQGVAAAVAGDLQRACRELGDAVRALPQRADLRARYHLAAASLAAARGFADQAAAHLRKTLDFDPRCEEALLALRQMRT